MSTASTHEASSKHGVPSIADDDLRPEYDFSNAVRGQHYHSLHEGYIIKIHKSDGTTEVQQVMFEPGTVRIAPDVQVYFPDAQAVNRALRSLMSIMEQLPDATRKKRRTRTKRTTASPHQVVKSSE